MDTVSRRFAEARNRSCIEWQKNPPTYHELRSVSQRLYREQGVDTQTLLGHRNAKTTDVYNDPRGAEWGTVAT